MSLIRVALNHSELLQVNLATTRFAVPQSRHPADPNFSLKFEPNGSDSGTIERVQAASSI